MLDLFTRKKLFDLNTSSNGSQVQVEKAIFSETSSVHSCISPSHDENTDPKVLYRLILSCDENRLLLCQIRDKNFEDIEKIWIPTDRRKGQIVAFSFNRIGTECIILTDETYIYKIPLSFKTVYDHENQVERKIVEENAKVIRSCSLTRPSAILWWDRSRFNTVRSSIAIIANRSGQICLLDLDTQDEIRRLTVPFAVESLQIYEEIYSRTLLINCAKNFQYYVTLEQLRSAAKKKNQTPETPSAISAFQYGFYLINNSHSNNDEGKSIFDSSVKPQPISFKEEEKKLIETENNKTYEDFIEIFENDLHVSLWPQESSKFLYIVKQCKLGFEFESEGSSSPKSGNSLEFCSITKKERNLDIYEFNSQEFCSEKVFLNSATKYFYVGLNAKAFNDSDSVYDSKFLKIINCGERFMVLVFTKFVVIVSKHFAEQKSLSSHSPRSPLVLKKNDSFRNSGSFRRKNYSAHNTVAKSNSLPLTSVVETFTPNDCCPIFDSNDEIVNVFYTTKSSLYGTTNCTLCSSTECNSACNEVERIFNIEVCSIEHKLNDDIRNLFKMNEQFLIVTKNGTFHYITCQESTFGDYFHNKICELLNVVDDGSTCLDGDLITNAKYIVDCFVARTNLMGNQKFFCRLCQANISPQNRFTTWQFWITRSGLLLLSDLSKTTFCDDKFRKILRLFELARTPRRRVITSLIYFKFWNQALYFLKKYFETSILQELNGEERLFLSHQMFNCLLVKINNPDVNSYEESLEELLKFLKDYFFYYDIEIIFDVLLEKDLFNIAKYVARINYSHVQLIEIILKNIKLHKNTISDEELFEYFSQPDIGYHLLLSTCYPTNAILEERIFTLKTFEEYLEFILKNLSFMNIEQLTRVERIFDPTCLHMQMLFQNILPYSDEGYVLQSLNNSFERREIINFYLFILLVTFQRRLNVISSKPEEFQYYDWNFLSDIRDNFQQFKHNKILPLSTARSNTFLCCGAYFSLLVLNDEKSNCVFLWGKFPYSHPCDSAPENTVRSSRTPIMLKFFTYLLPPGALISIAAGAQHILFLTDFGIFVLGSSTYGQLGLGLAYRRTRLPAPIKKFFLNNPDHVKIVKIACGSYHSLAISDCGHLYGWGWALHGQIGNDNNEDVFVPQRIDFLQNEPVKVIDAAAGYAHSVVLCENGDLYVFGDNSYNQLGVELESKALKSTVPVRMCNIKFGTIRLICCGLYHTVALAVDDSTDKQKIYSWGLDPKTWRLKMRSERKSDPTVRGNSNLKDFSSPMEINLDCIENHKQSRIIKICSGQAHNVLLTEDGLVLSFGFGREGQLGLGPDTANARVGAKIVPELVNATDISVGVVHSLAVTKDSLWGWGQNAEMNSFSNNTEESEQNSKTNRSQQEEFWSTKLASYQKNIESIPYKIVQFDKLLQNSMKSNLIFNENRLKNYYFPGFTNVSIVEKLKKCLVKFEDAFDLEKCVTRFETFHLIQLSSVLSFAKSDFLRSFQYQIKILKDELKRSSSKNSTNYEKYYEEFKNLSLFFFETMLKKSSNENEMTFSHLNTLIETWNDAENVFKSNNSCGKFSLKRLLSELYLKENEDDSITTPYFGLNLMKVISLNDHIRQQFELDDQFMLDVLSKTSTLTQKYPENIVQFQIFMEQFSLFDNQQENTQNSGSIQSGSVAESQKSNLNFPLELVWRKNMAMLLKEDMN